MTWQVINIGVLGVQQRFGVQGWHFKVYVLEFDVLGFGFRVMDGVKVRCQYVSWCVSVNIEKLENHHY